jgi:drug/metabolite transporter (DMT)-like permease
LIGGNVTIAPLVFLTGIASGLFYALYSIFGEIALRKYDTMTVTVWTFIFGLIGSLPLGKPAATIRVLTSEPILILYAFGIGILSTVLPYFLYTWGLGRMETSKAAILVAVEPLVGCVIGMTLFHEPHNIQKILGIILILASIILLNLNLKKSSYFIRTK